MRDNYTLTLEDERNALLAERDRLRALLETVLLSDDGHPAIRTASVPKTLFVEIRAALAEKG